jgi:polar amino acid transport system permease protein
VIAGGDLPTVAQAISGANYRTIEMLIVAAAWYFAVIAALSVGQHFLERRIAER